MTGAPHRNEAGCRPHAEHAGDLAATIEHRGTLQQPLRHRYGQEFEHQAPEHDQEIGEYEVEPRVGTDCADQLPRQAGNQAERCVRQRETSHVGNRQRGGAPCRGRRACGAASDDRRGDGDHRINARCEARQHSTRKYRSHCGDRMPGQQTHDGSILHTGT
jgi:hypothetical protein